jgi:hypothetical protein
MKQRHAAQTERERVSKQIGLIPHDAINTRPLLLRNDLAH